MTKLDLKWYDAMTFQLAFLYLIISSITQSRLCYFYKYTACDDDDEGIYLTWASTWTLFEHIPLKMNLILFGLEGEKLN